jgi:hypothetical protein
MMRCFVCGQPTTTKLGYEMDAGTRTLLSDRNLAERRLTAIVQAIQRHEREQERKPYPRRGDDLDLYRRTREILGEEPPV